MANRWGESKNSDILFSWFSKSLWAVTATTKLKHTCSLEEKPWKTETVLESGDITLPTKAHIVKAVTYPVVINRHESWIIKNVEHWRTDAFELWCWRRLLRIPWTARRSNKSIPKGNQSWIFIGRTDAEAEAPIFLPPEVKSWLIGKDPDAGKNWGQEKKGVAGNEMLGWLHWLNGHEFEQQRYSEGQGSLVWCSLWCHKELDTT